MDPNTDDRLDHDDLTDAERAELEAGDEEAQQATAAAQPDPDPQPDEREVLLASAKAATDAANAAAEALRRQQPPAPAPEPDPPAPAARDFGAELAALRERYDAGEIDRDEFYDARLTLEAERNDALVDQRVNERLQAREQQSTQQQWESAYAGFLGDQVNARLTGPALNAAFNTAIQSIYQQDPSISHADLLTKARDQVFAEIGVEVPNAKNLQDKIQDAVNNRRSKDAPPMDTGRIPQAGNLSASAQDAQLDDMSADQLEDWLARNPAKAEEYLAGAPGGLRDYPRQVA